MKSAGGASAFEEPRVEGLTRTRFPGAAMRALALELELASPQAARLAMMRHWPDAFQRVDQLAADLRTRPFPLLLRALAAGLDAIEAEARNG